MRISVSQFFNSHELFILFRRILMKKMMEKLKQEFLSLIFRMLFQQFFYPLPFEK